MTLTVAVAGLRKRRGFGNERAGRTKPPAREASHVWPCFAQDRFQAGKSAAQIVEAVAGELVWQEKRGGEVYTFMWRGNGAFQNNKGAGRKGERARGVTLDS